MADRQHDPHQVLGIQRSATQNEIRRAFRRLAMKHHPDRNPSPAAEARFKEIAAAYETLSDPKKRDEYDHDSNAQSSSDSTSNETAARSIVVSGQGNGILTISLHEGIWACDVSVSNKIGSSSPGIFVALLTGRNGGHASLKSAITLHAISRTHVTVRRTGSASIRPGIIDVKVRANCDWSVVFILQSDSSRPAAEERPQPAATAHFSRQDPAARVSEQGIDVKMVARWAINRLSKATMAGAWRPWRRSRSRSNSARSFISLSGRGAATETIDLAEGIWLCYVSVAHNARAGRLSPLLGGADHFSVKLIDRNSQSKFMAIIDTSYWSSRSHISVGYKPFDIAPGRIDVEVEATGRWTVECVLQ